MLTKILNDPFEAAQIVRSGGIVAFPTETVYGLGADATNAAAVARLFVAKGRPSDNPLIVHVAKSEQLRYVARQITESASILLREFSPGPITVVLPKNGSIVPAVTAGLDSVGVRIPDHPVARAFLKRAALPVAAPSANRSGRPSGTSTQAVLEDLDGLIDAILIGDVTRLGLESTVVDCSTDPPRLLRPGAVTFEQLSHVLPDISLIGDEARRTDNSPGLRYAHYQPAARVRLISSVSEVSVGPSSAFLGMDSIDGNERLGLYRCFQDIEQYARQFFELLRMADRKGIDVIYCQRVPEIGVGRALADRLRRSAG